MTSPSSDSSGVQGMKYSRSEGKTVTGPPSLTLCAPVPVTSQLIFHPSCIYYFFFCSRYIPFFDALV